MLGGGVCMCTGHRIRLNDTAPTQVFTSTDSHTLRDHIHAIRRIGPHAKSVLGCEAENVTLNSSVAHQSAGVRSDFWSPASLGMAPRPSMQRHMPGPLCACKLQRLQLRGMLHREQVLVPGTLRLPHSLVHQL